MRLSVPADAISGESMRETMRLRGRAMLMTIALLGSGVLPVLGQQDGAVHPITSLPKAPGDQTTVVPAAMAQRDAAAAAQPSAMATPAVAAPATAVSTPAAVTTAATVTTAAGTTVTTAATPVPAPAAANGGAVAGGAPVNSIAYPPPPARGEASSSGGSIVPMGDAVQPYKLPEPATVERRRPAENYAPSEHIGPFSTIAVGAKGGFAGFGLDLATPLARNFNARVGATFYSYSGSYNVDGVTINGEAKFRAATVMLDYFPAYRSQFRMSVGLNLYNGNNLNASATVPGGVEFDLGDAEFFSSPTDPIHGTASMTFGNRVAPMVTIGFGNMIPRDGGRFSFPFEIGVEFNVKQPMLAMYLMGSACQSDPTQPGFDPATCGPVQMDQTNIQQEENEVNSDIHFLRFYPIISQGFAVRF